MMIFIYNLIGLNISIKNRLKIIILISCLFLAAFSFLLSMVIAYKYGGVDLRNKVVGARLLLKGINPYIVPPKPPEDEWFLDPVQRYPGRSRVTVTPPVLLFYGIFAWVPYSLQRFIWAIMEWIAMVATLFFLLKNAGSDKVRYYLTCFCLVFFCSQYFWMLHIERGQYYIYLAFLLSLAIYLEMNFKESGKLRSGGTVGRPGLFCISTSAWRGPCG
jgi:hypothetical protein